MAEDIDITQIMDQGLKVPQWATETTLQNLVTALDAGSKKSGSTANKATKATDAFSMALTKAAPGPSKLAGAAMDAASGLINFGTTLVKAALTTSTAESDTVTDTSLATIKADKFETEGLSIVDNDITGANSNADLNISASGTGNVKINNLVEVGSASLDLGQITIEGNEIFSNESNADVKISANSSGQIHFDDFTKMTAQGSDPTAVAGHTHLYAKTESGGGTGLFYVNTSSSGELVSKAKAQIFGLIF